MSKDVYVSFDWFDNLGAAYGPDRRARISSYIEWINKNTEWHEFNEFFDDVGRPNYARMYKGVMLGEVDACAFKLKFGL